MLHLSMIDSDSIKTIFAIELNDDSSIADYEVKIGGQ